MSYLDSSQLIFSETLLLRGEQVVTSVEKKSWGKQRIIKPPKFFETWLVYLVLPGCTHRTFNTHKKYVVDKQTYFHDILWTISKHSSNP